MDKERKNGAPQSRGSFDSNDLYLGIYAEDSHGFFNQRVFDTTGYKFRPLAQETYGSTMQVDNSVFIYARKHHRDIQNKAIGWYNAEQPERGPVLPTKIYQGSR